MHRLEGPPLAEVLVPDTYPMDNPARDMFNMKARNQVTRAAGLTSPIHLSEGTRRNYVSSVFEKLEVSDLTLAAVLAIRYGRVYFAVALAHAVGALLLSHWMVPSSFVSSMYVGGSYLRP